MYFLSRHTAIPWDKACVITVWLVWLHSVVSDEESFPVGCCCVSWESLSSTVCSRLSSLSLSFTETSDAQVWAKTTNSHVVLVTTIVIAALISDKNTPELSNASLLSQHSGSFSCITTTSKHPGHAAWARNPQDRASSLSFFEHEKRSNPLSLWLPFSPHMTNILPVATVHHGRGFYSASRCLWFTWIRIWK